jgi:hypothetical protein
MDAPLAAFAGGAERGGPETAVPREYDTGGAISEGLTFAARGGFACDASAGAVRFVGGLDSVTGGYSLFRDA